MTEKDSGPAVSESDIGGEIVRKRQTPPGEQAFYEIKVKGHLDSLWSEWFDDLAVTHDESGNTILSGLVADQAALHGLLIKVRDLGLPLLFVTHRAGVEDETPGDETDGPGTA